MLWFHYFQYYLRNLGFKNLKLRISFFIALDLHLNHCAKIVRIQSFSGPYSVRMRENPDQKDFE